MKNVAELRLPGLVLLLVLFTTTGVDATQAVDQQQPIIDTGVGGLAVGGASQQKLAQVVTAGASGALIEVRLPVSCASGDLVVEIQGVTAGVPDGTVLASQTIAGASVPSFTPGGVSFRSLVLGAALPLTAGSQFAVVLSSAGQCGMFQGPPGDSYPGGTAFFDARPNRPGVWVCLCDFAGGRFDLPFETVMETIADVGDFATCAGATPCECAGLDACRDNTGAVGEDACIGDLACFANSGDVAKNGCRGILACRQNMGAVGEGACQVPALEPPPGRGACELNEGDVRKAGCIGPSACDSKVGPVGEAACVGDEACALAVGEIGKLSCRGDRACLGRTGAVRENACVGEDSCRGSGSGAIGKSACHGARACLGNPGPIPVGACIGPPDPVSGKGVCEP